MSLQVHMIAFKWVVSDDQSIRYPNEFGNSLENSLKLSTPIAYDCVTSVETCEKALHELYHPHQIISFGLV